MERPHLLAKSDNAYSSTKVAKVAKALVKSNDFQEIRSINAATEGAAASSAGNNLARSE